ncbi:MAG: CDP-alcohol phosphatidyltransferase family protein [Desulfobacterota bacterium]|nr:CDP-alcohol phosphatidyltransferase family protein [Thermodesulfobacteriota bacterium]
MTIPNLITAFRIILAPVFVIYLINDRLTSALIVFLVCMISDGIDGMVARLFNQKSRLGAYLDPLADKTLLVTAFVLLGVRGYLPSWLTVTAIARDVMILLGVLVFHLNRLEIKIRPSAVSKINTCFQFITLTMVLLKGCVLLPAAIYDALYYITAALTIISGLHYMQYGLRVMGEGTGSNAGRGERKEKAEESK